MTSLFYSEYLPPPVSGIEGESMPTTSFPVFPAATQVYAIGIDGSNRRLFTSDWDSIADMAMSGNGRVLFYTTGTSRLVRVDVGPETVTELAAATPMLTSAYRVAPPQQTATAAVGSVVDLYGAGLASVTELSPATAGEIVWTYMSGLGRWTPTVAWPDFLCQFDTISGEVLYAGLAPGLTGFYQLNVRVPAGARASALFCGWRDSRGGASMTVWVQ